MNSPTSCWHFSMYFQVLTNGTLQEVLAGYGMVIEDSDYLFRDRFKTILRAYFRTTFNNVKSTFWFNYFILNDSSANYFWTSVVIPIELHPSYMYASAGPDFGGVTDWHQSFGYSELSVFKT